MKKLLLLILALASFGRAEIVIDGGRVQWSDSVKWGGANDSVSSYFVRGNTIKRDSNGVAGVVNITSDSCSKPVKMALGQQTLNTKLEFSYEVRTSSGNTDSSQVIWRVDSRYCPGLTGTCDSWVPAGRFKGDTATFIQDSIISLATSSGTTWRPTRQIFDVPGGSQIRFCVDSYKAGGETGDTTFFRKHVVRTSSVPAGGVPPASSEAISSALPAGNNHVGSVKVDTIATGVNHIGSVKIDTLPVLPTGTNSIGQVTANAGTNLNTSALALDATVGRAQGSTTSGQTGPIVQGAVTTSAPSYTTAQTSPLSLTPAGALRTDASATTQPVSIASLPSGAVTNTGTFPVQAAQSGTWTMQPGNTANTTAWKVDGSAVTQPVSIATLPALAAGSALVGMVDLGFSTRSDTYTTTGNGTAVAFTTTPRKHWAIQLTGTGATPTTWDVRLEGSLDGVTYTNIVQHTQVDGQGVTKWSTTTISPCLYFRSRCAGLALGSATNIVVVILGMD